MNEANNRGDAYKSKIITIRKETFRENKKTKYNGWHNINILSQ